MNASCREDDYYDQLTEYREEPELEPEYETISLCTRIANNWRLDVAITVDTYTGQVAEELWTTSRKANPNPNSHIWTDEDYHPSLREAVEFFLKTTAKSTPNYEEKTEMEIELLTQALNELSKLKF